jgi:alpha-1,2-glucosyltransferase
MRSNSTFERISSLIGAFIYFQLNWFIFKLINKNVNEPYMDEIFHIPQTQAYCLGNFDVVR